MKAFLLAFIIGAWSASEAVAKTWTNRDGKTLEAEFVSVYGPSGSENVKLKLPEGREVTVPLQTLSDEDQTFIKDQSASLALAEASVIYQAIEGKLVSVQENKVQKVEVASAPKYYALYFSASWCPPCRNFTPKLVEFYKQSPKAGKDFEVILVSSDSTEKDMEKYMQDFGITFPAIQYRYAKRIEEVAQHRGNGIPCLVLLDQEGKVLFHSYEKGEYVGPSYVLSELKKL